VSTAQALDLSDSQGEPFSMNERCAVDPSRTVRRSVYGLELSTESGAP